MLGFTSTHSGTDTLHADPHAYVRSASQTAPLYPPSVVNMSDILFNFAVEKLAGPPATAMKQNGLTNPAVLMHFPRKTAEELGLAASDRRRTKVCRGSESLEVVSLMVIGHGGIGYDAGTGVARGIGSIGRGTAAATTDIVLPVFLPIWLVS